jgi:phosphoribosyl-AMP cyclohydrolase
MHVRTVRIDCDGDAVLLQVHADGPACHTGERSCFFTQLENASDTGSVNTKVD